MANTTPHNFRIPDDLWEQFIATTSRDYEKPTAVVIRLIRNYVQDHE